MNQPGVDVYPAHRDILSKLPVGLVPSDPSHAPKTIGSLITAKIETAIYKQFDRQAMHAAQGMGHLVTVQNYIVELGLIQKTAKKRAAELDRDIASVHVEIEQIQARGRRLIALYPETLALERAQLVAQREEIEAQAKLRALEYERLAIAVQLERANADRDALIARSQGEKGAATNLLEAAQANVQTALLQARSAAEVATIQAEATPPILPKERHAWEQRRETEGEKRAAAQRIHEAAEVIATQAIAGAVQLPQVSPYSAYAWLTYQQEYDRFLADHDKAFAATIGHLVQRMSNGGISIADAEVSYETYRKMSSDNTTSSKDASFADMLGSLGVTDAHR
jgi:hypothetical protein